MNTSTKADCRIYEDLKGKWQVIWYPAKRVFKALSATTKEDALAQARAQGFQSYLDGYSKNVVML